MSEKHPDDYLVITRWPGFYQWLVEDGIVPHGTRYSSRVDRDEVVGKILVGPVPHYLAVLAKAVIYLPVNLPKDFRGDITADVCREYQGSRMVYQARRIQEEQSPDLAQTARLALTELKNLGAAESVCEMLEAAIAGRAPAERKVA